MGIQGLLIGLKPFSTPGHIQDFRGKALAIDTSSWLHKSVYSIADHYVECIEQNKLDGRCVNTSAKYITQRCEELLTGAGIQRIYLVMDGKRCPLKAGTNQERDARRQENLRQARTYRKQKRHDAMCEKYRSCIKVTEELATSVVRLVQKRLAGSVEIVWSPYEADAQLAQLCVDGRAAAVVTEDSDVLVYSASSRKIFPIIFKLDRRSGECDILSLDWLLNADTKQEPPRAKDMEVTILEVILRVLRSREVAKPGWGSRLFVQGCVLAGCDYAPRKVAGVGLVSAFKLVRNAGCTGSPRNLSKVFRQILFSTISGKSRGALGDVSEFENLLAQSEAVFYYHPVALQDGTITHLNNISANDSLFPSIERFEDTIFLGSLVANPNESCIIPTVATRQKHKSPPKPSKQKQRPLSVSKIINPYKRKPLVNRSPNKSNIFAAYAKRHKQPEMQRRSFNIVTAQLPVKPKEPPRPLKRNFEYAVGEGSKQRSDEAPHARKDHESPLESPPRKVQKPNPDFSYQSTRHVWSPSAYNDYRTTNSPTPVTSKTHIRRPQLSMHPESRLASAGDKKPKCPGQPRHAVPPVVSIKHYDVPNLNIGSQLTMDDDFNETSAYFKKTGDESNAIDVLRPPEDSTTAAFCYSPNLLDDIIPSPPQQPAEFANSADLVDQQDVYRRVTLGVTPFSARRATQRSQGDLEPQKSESPIIDLSGDVEQGPAFPSSSAKSEHAASPGVLRYCVGGGLASAKSVPKRRNPFVAKFLRKQRAKTGLQTKMSEWFQKRTK